MTNTKCVIYWGKYMYFNNKLQKISLTKFFHMNKLKGLKDIHNYSLIK